MSQNGILCLEVNLKASDQALSHSDCAKTAKKESARCALQRGSGERDRTSDTGLMSPLLKSNARQNRLTPAFRNKTIQLKAGVIFMPRKAMTVQAALAEYEFVIMELSPQTQTWYMRRIDRFAKWCAQKRLHLHELKPAHVATYLQVLRQPSQRTGKPLSTYTLHGHMRCIRTFLFWCAKPPQRYISKEVPDNLVMPIIEERIIEPFTKQQIEAMHVAIGQNIFPIMVARNKAIIDVLVDTGIRAGELCDLTINNVHITAKEGYIKVFGKGKKEREIPLGVRSRKSLNEYIKRFRPTIAGENHVFLGHKHEPMTVNSLDQMLGRLARHAKITGVRCSAHTFRHTFAIHFLLQGGDLFMLSRLLGHESVEVTQIYLRAVKGIQARKTSKSVLNNL